jgi:dihydrofolate reductase
MKIGLIFARARSGAVGKDGVMPWHLPEDLAHFKRVTLGCPVIMGRKTWDSLPERFRPLPGRTNIVISRDAGWRATGALRAASLDEALGLCAGAPDVWVIGGAQIWALALARADSAQVTEIEIDVDGDTFAPHFGPQWQETARERHVSAQGVGYSFVTYQNTARGA